MKFPSHPPEFAKEWCRSLGVNVNTLELLKGGINNEVFICGVGDHSFVLKRYAEASVEKHDRFQAEVDFLSYAQLVAPEFVPRLLHTDDVSRSLVLEFLKGDRFEDGMHPSEEDIGQALTFMLCLNADLALAKREIQNNAAESFLTLTEHLWNIEHRIKRMGSEHVPQCLKTNVDRIISRLKRQLEALQERTTELIARGYCEDLMEPDKLCISPSDFGFHNAIHSAGKVRFFDFEFAGWDDPAKAIIDFDLQPRVPIELKNNVLRKGLPDHYRGLKERCQALLPILRLKWACIILAPMDPVRWSKHNRVSKGHDLADQLQAKLLLVNNYLDED